jgi:hypothetical protein
MTIVLIILLSVVILEVLGVILQSRKDYSHKIFTSSGCNVFNNPHTEEYCIEHDKAYGRGGWCIARFKADWNLFKCIWKKRKLLAIVMFLGIRLFGSFEFEYGKKRKLTYPDGSTD